MKNIYYFNTLITTHYFETKELALIIEKLKMKVEKISKNFSQFCRKIYFRKTNSKENKWQVSSPK